MNEENNKRLAEVKSSLEIVFSNVRTLKREIHVIKQSLSDFESTMQSFEENLSTINQLSTNIEEIKQTISELQESFNEQRASQQDLVQPLSTAIEGVQSKILTVEENILKVSATEESIGEVRNSVQKIIESFSQQEPKYKEIQMRFENLTPDLDSLKSNYEKNYELINRISNDFSQFKGTADEKIGQILIESESNKNIINEYETKIDGLSNRIANLESVLEETTANVTNITHLTTQIDTLTSSTTGLLNRVQNLEEKAGISTGELIGTGFDNLGMLRQLVADLLGEDKVDYYIPVESGKDPILVINSLKGIIRDLSFIDESNSLNTSEILLKYSETADSRADRRTLIVNYNKDIQRILEIGQSVLMDIGQKRMQTRNIIEEIRNLARQWTSEDDVRGESGVFMALDLLETLEKEF
ncbi:MAG: hypothetical protein ACFFB5_18505 [Promethearchaeota archaeon]